MRPTYFLFQMKIQGQNKQMLAAACQMFMGKSEAEIAHIALETLEGHQRAIIAHLTVEVWITWLPPVFSITTLVSLKLVLQVHRLETSKTVYVIIAVLLATQNKEQGQCTS